MVTEEEVQHLMKEVFPRCPICGTDKGYKVSGAFKTYVECNDCGARWFNSAFTFPKLETMQLWEPPKKGQFAGKFRELLKKTKSLEFWYEVNKDYTGYQKEEYHKFETQTEVNKLSESKMYLWSEIIKPNILDNIKDKYVIVFDQTVVGFKFDNLPKTINIMAEKGWRCVNITAIYGDDVRSRHMYALMEKI